MINPQAAAPLKARLFTPGVGVLLILMVNAAIVVIRRFLFGLGEVTNLDNFYPWGIWIAIDVASGVALAAGGFTTAILVEIFHRHRYLPLLRPALLTALLGYTFVAGGVFLDIGRYYNIWHPLVPAMWSGHSALFEVAMCVMTYVTVLYIELVPVLVERFRGRVNLPAALARLNAPAEFVLKLLDGIFGRTMFLFTIFGVVLSCMHQSSLGAIMLLAPTKIDPLWWTPILPLLFLLSAISVGYPMVIVESMLASRSFGRKPEIALLSSLARFIIFSLGLYLSAKIIDWVVRDQVGRLFSGDLPSILCLIEFLFGAVAPFFMLLSSRMRRNPRFLFTAALMIVFGVLFNRINVYLTAYTPPFAQSVYFPSFSEISLTVGMIAGLMFLYRVIVMIFPVIPEGEPAHARP